MKEVTVQCWSLSLKLKKLLPFALPDLIKMVLLLFLANLISAILLEYTGWRTTLRSFSPFFVVIISVRPTAICSASSPRLPAYSA
jgi:hypothetical protein